MIVFSLVFSTFKLPGEASNCLYIVFFFLTKLPIYCYFRCQCEFSVSHLGNEFAFSVCKNKRCAISSFGVLNVFYWLCINVELWFWSSTPSFHGYILLYLFTWILGIKSPKSIPLCFRVMNVFWIIWHNQFESCEFYSCYFFFFWENVTFLCHFLHYPSIFF
jgi:hypothetical protein